MNTETLNLNQGLSKTNNPLMGAKSLIMPVI